MKNRCIMRLLKAAVVYPVFAVTLCGCKKDEPAPVFNETEMTEEVPSVETETEEGKIENDNKGEEKMSTKIEKKPFLKSLINHNPVMTQRFGADPYALVYDGRVYLYMTGDDFMYEADGSIKENNYSNINKINVISSADLVNWTDHGTVYAAGPKGAATWGGNSWAPAAAYKNIDGKDKFFLYFANSGNGIAVLESDTPYGPFTDPIGKALISRETPTCASVAWLFDPAVLMDGDDAYIYFGGGIPSPDKADNPGTARVAKLGADMISLDGDPVPIENVPYLFEDSGINKFGDTYYYSYCSNFSMTPEAVSELKFEQGEIVVMKSDNPMGPFELVKGVLKNPGYFFGEGGNNHHCMFEFNGEWYITYHARLLEKEMGVLKGYRSTNIDKLSLDENKAPKIALGTKEGVKQVKAFDPFETVSAVTLGNASGIETVQYGESAEKYGSGQMILTGISDGSWTGIYGADFKDGAHKLTVSVRGEGTGTINVYLDSLGGDPICVLDVNAPGAEFTEITGALDKVPEGEHNLFFIFTGSDYELLSWKFEK